MLVLTFICNNLLGCNMEEGMNEYEEWELSENYCDWYFYMEHENYECEPTDYVWNWLSDQWQCSKCSQGLHRIYNPKNTLNYWIQEVEE